MSRSRAVCVFSALLLIAGLTLAGEQALYDSQANANQQVAAAIAEATSTRRNVVIVFGANW